VYDDLRSKYPTLPRPPLWMGGHAQPPGGYEEIPLSLDLRDVQSAPLHPTSGPAVSPPLGFSP